MRVGFNSIFVPLKIIVQVYNCLLYRISEILFEQSFLYEKKVKTLFIELL